MKITNFVYSILIILPAVSAQAQSVIQQNNFIVHSYGRCVDEYITSVGVQTRAVSACSAVPLSLASKDHYYPQLRENPRHVQYWQGGYKKTFATTRKFIRELVDTCRGRILSTKYFYKTETYEKSYSVINPNLDASINESFRLVPMTEQEAQVGLSLALASCRAD